ncbi:MAG: FHA domain-containing protein [Pseudomonadota bacterium]
MSKEPRIEILKGNDSGTQFRITGSRVLFGRSSDCDVVVTDPSASRNHAELVKMGEKFLLRDLKSSNGILINGKKIPESVLVDGDIFSIGSHSYKYIEVDSAAQPQQVASENRQVSREGTIPGLQMSSSSTGVNIPGLPSGMSGANVNKKRMIIYGVVLGVLLIFFIFLFASGDSKPVQPAAVGNNNATAATTLEPPTEVDEEVAYRRKIPDDERQLFDKANEYYFEGERELRLKNYSRALDDFRKALSFYPQHARAKTAVNSTSEKIKEESLLQMSLGKKMFSHKRYDDAIRHFTDVINLNVRQSDGDIFKEAEKWKNMAEKRRGEAFEQ